MAVDRHRPLAHLSGQYRLPLDVACVNNLLKTLGTAWLPHKWGGSSLPSRHETMALQYSYSGRHSPLLQGNVCSGHFLDFLKSQPISSSPLGHWGLPSQRAAREMHLLLLKHLKDKSGHLKSVTLLFPEILHSSSEASLQSGRPSQTKNQLIQTPLERH